MVHLVFEICINQEGNKIRIFVQIMTCDYRTILGQRTNVNEINNDNKQVCNFRHGSLIRNLQKWKIYRRLENQNFWHLTKYSISAICVVL